MKQRGIILLAAVAAALVAVVGATAQNDSTKQSNSTTLNGAGATFPFPLISKWIPAYDQATGVQINYSPIGSGGGIAPITTRTGDFGGSRPPLPPDRSP